MIFEHKRTMIFSLGFHNITIVREKNWFTSSLSAEGLNVFRCITLARVSAITWAAMNIYISQVMQSTVHETVLALYRMRKDNNISLIKLGRYIF